MKVIFNFEDRTGKSKIAEGFFKKIAEDFIKLTGLRNNFELSLFILSDSEIRKLNKIYQGNMNISQMERSLSIV